MDNLVANLGYEVDKKLFDILSILDMVSASILPPLMITPTLPEPDKAPLSNAANPSAPEGSTTIFMR